MKIDGVDFNHAWAKEKTEAQFVDEFKGHEHIFPEAKDKVAKLKAAHALLIKTPLEEDEAVEVVKQPSLATNNPGPAKA